MALSRRTGARFQASIWPGFVDAMTGLLLVLMFVLTIFMIVQFVLTERISGQETELDVLSNEVAALAQALGLEQSERSNLEARVGALSTELGTVEDRAAQQILQIAALTAQRDTGLANLAQAQTQITGFEAQVAALLADRQDAQTRAVTLLAEREDARTRAAALLQERDGALADVANLQTAQTELLSEQEALNAALASSRSETDAATEVARLAAARREALSALVEDLRARNADANDEAARLSAQAQAAQEALSELEIARLADAAAAQALRDRLEGAGTELTAMTLALEAQRKDAEDTLTLLAAARAAEGELDARLAAALAEAGTLQTRIDETEAEKTTRLKALRAELAKAVAAQQAAEAAAGETLTTADQRAALLAQAQTELAKEQETSLAAQRQTELLNQQVAALRIQLGDLQGLLDGAVAEDASKQVELQSLGSQLNTALARVAAEQSRRAELEAAERKRLEAQAIDLQAQTKDLEQYRSEFFGQLRDVLGNQEGVRIEGDRFVFSSEVLFPPGGAILSTEGQGEIAKVASILSAVAADIPNEIDWVIRVDGHTDDQPLSGFGEFADNWELSQARALSVVKYMSNFLGIPPDRMSANGFGQYQPVARGDSDEARARNRRIELKFTEK
ncbi:flagellar motor protein [Sulfitobacter sp. SK012]|uniref:peptidoglycan -binding protein n=1 Tax=Sulfitobacter sp. SK012 TaxID=1389005 RepID=UPI000E0B300D|nr:peptidoglycan -binding protein [Sulfitobacter sp. SK012]AXI45344.1 flagellar motor protein [Sulfitobacter sp. SK012]